MAAGHRMNNTLKAGLAALVMAFSLVVTSGGVSFAQDLQKGVGAYNKGDIAIALREFRALAEQGNAQGQFNLGVMYAMGQGVIQDYSEAVKWYRKSVEQGDADAQYNLGWMYHEGQGVIQDNIYAHMWWNIAASTGHSTAKKNRDTIAKRMTPADISKAQELARECVKKQFKDC